jgi:hypothetical protein
MFIKLNETYKLLEKTPENNNTNKQTGKLLSKIYEYYMDKIENYTNIEEINLKEMEDKCHKLTYLKKIKKNDDFDLSYLKEPSLVNRGKMDKYISDIELLFDNLKLENINLMNSIEIINEKIMKVSNIFDIIMEIRTKTEDIITCRYFQYRLIDIIINIYKKIKVLLERNELDKILNKKEEDNLITNCLNIFKKITLLNRDYFQYYFKVNNNPASSGYKYSIYDIPSYYLILMIGKIHDYYNNEKVVDNQMTDIEVTYLIDKIFSIYLINDSDEMIKIGELIHEIKNNNNIKYLIKEKKNKKVSENGPL